MIKEIKQLVKENYILGIGTIAIVGMFSLNSFFEINKYQKIVRNQIPISLEIKDVNKDGLEDIVIKSKSTEFIFYQNKNKTYTQKESQQHL